VHRQTNAIFRKETEVTLQEQIKQDLVAAMKAKDETLKSALRVVLGELGRLPEKQLSDDQIIKVIRKLIKAEREVLAQSGGGATSAFITALEAYLPQMASEEEIRSWISANVDFDKFKNKMQAMGQIMQHFGSGADGNTVKQVLAAFEP
jgi:uncharacterized protein YqeY